MARINESFYSTTPVVDEQTKRAGQKAVAPTPAVDTRAALAKLTSGRTLTPAERVALGMSPAPTTATTTPTAVTPKPTTTPAPKPTVTPTPTPTPIQVGGKKVVSTYIDPETGDTYSIYDDNSRELIAKGTKALNAAAEAKRIAEEKMRQGQSAYSLLFEEFNRYGMGALVEPLKALIQDGLSPAEFTLRLRETDAYKKRFAANAKRIASGLAAISEAEYIGLEDAYQTVMRNYGLPASYYTRGEMGRQEGFENFIANDVSAPELEDRIMNAQSRVLNANPEVLASLKQFYPGINNGDILAYALDPQKALTDIKRKITAAEIGGAATQAGLGITGTRAEELGAAGINKQQAQAGFQTVAEVAPRGGQLAAIYGESPYTQQTAEQEVFGLAGSTEAAKQRRKLVGLEKAAFSGQTGAAQGALGRERAGNL